MNGREKKRDVGAPVAPLPVPLFRVIGESYALLLLLLLVLLDGEFVVVSDVLVDDDGNVEDTDFKYFKLSQWLLYSIGVFGLKLRMRLRVSLTESSRSKKKTKTNENLRTFFTHYISTHFYWCSSGLRHYGSTPTTNPPAMIHFEKTIIESNAID